MNVTLPSNGWKPRSYQRPLWRYLENGGRRAIAVWHRRSGKDEVALHRFACAAFERPANYWHMLPLANQARKAIWDAVNPRTGIRRIDEAFPHELRETTRENEMLIKFKNGSTYQVVGSDNFNTLIGSPPAGIAYSEWAVAKPQAPIYLRPILLENGGWELYITTPRGRNHALRTLESFRDDKDAFAQVLTAEQTGVIPHDILEQELKNYVREYGEDEGEAFWRQEFMCDFNAAVLGAILGKALARAERDGRICSVAVDPDGAAVDVSSDIGFRDTAAWWFWQPKVGGFSLIDYDDDTGLDADDWIERLKTKVEKTGCKLGKIWLPHDARAKTFQSKHSVVEKFLSAFGPEHIGVVPMASKSDRINASRSIMSRCEFDSDKCAQGLDGLREWSFEYNEDSHTFSKEPRHDWASHPGDAFSYGAQVMAERIGESQKDKPRSLIVGENELTMNDMWAIHESQARREARI